MGGSSHAENQAVVDEQKKQAADLAAKEAARKARIQTGLKKIGWAFEGKPVTAATSHAFDWKGFNDKSVLPKGYTRVQVGANGKAIPGTPATPGTQTQVTWDNGPDPIITAGQPGSPAVPAGSASGGVTGIQGPDGKIYKPGQAFSYTTNDPTGAVTGGFGQDFYQGYRDKQFNYYKSDIDKQKAKADQEAAFRLARAGLGVSSAANDVNADLESQNTANLAGVGNQADAAAATLKSKVAAEKKSTIDQLYQTEDPTLAANTALSEVRNLSVETPSMSPLADVFNIAAIGGANLLKNFNSQKAYNEFQTGLPGGAGSSRNITG